MDKKTNIILILTDQLRYDFLSINGNENIDTPTLDMMASQGCNFTNAYSAVPSCIAARCAIMTGMKQEHHKRVGYEDRLEWNYPNMLAEVFQRNNYHTQCVGKMHVYPQRKLCGYNNVILHDGYLHQARKSKYRKDEVYEDTDDYLKWLKEKTNGNMDLIDLGLSCNSWDQRPFPYDEYLHPSTWTVSESIDFLRRKDPTKPFFLTISFVRPHSPLDPPEYYYRKYIDKNVNMPFMGDWEKEYKERQYDIDAKYGRLPLKYILRQRQAYQGLISHIDHQINRFLMRLEEYDELNNTVFLFASDHGDMLGDHNFFRKSLGYEGSSHVPFIIYDPGNILNIKKRIVDKPVELRDIMPTLLDICNIDIPDTVDGLSLLGLMEDKDIDWRKYIHGEHAYGDLSNQYITDGKYKYIWYSITGEEQFFDLSKDRKEEKNLIEKEEYKEKIEEFRNYLIDELRNREEGFVKDNSLVKGRNPINTLKKEY